MRTSRNVLVGAVTVLLAACVAEPVDWGDVSYRRSQLGDPDTRSARLTANLPWVVGSVKVCEASVRATHGGADLFRVWWTARSDSSVVLAVQHSLDSGATWQAPLVVDARDRGRRACDRPAPDASFDSLSGYLHIVYFLETADGRGVFFAHSMDKGAMFHSPVPVVYGNSPSSAAVAAHGDSVVVVFEDPNATTPRIGIALSHTAGHIFEQRAQVTPDDVPARTPWVTLEGNTISVSWKLATPPGVVDSDRVGTRVGTWR
ncbi:MAG TPA: hypothetical protein VGD02_05800 [Gemmatimonadaceae bacterium]|jgi:hypothetical protein